MSTIESVAAMGRALWPPAGPFFSVKVWFSYPGAAPNVVQAPTGASGGPTSVIANVARFSTQGACVPQDADASATLSSAAQPFNTGLPLSQQDATARTYALEALGALVLAEMASAGISVFQTA
jgi:hypothetical protein